MFERVLNTPLKNGNEFHSQAISRGCQQQLRYEITNFKSVYHNCNLMCKGNQKRMFSKEYQMLIIPADSCLWKCQAFQRQCYFQEFLLSSETQGFFRFLITLMTAILFMIIHFIHRIFLDRSGFSFHVTADPQKMYPPRGIYLAILYI